MHTRARALAHTHTHVHRTHLQCHAFAQLYRSAPTQCTLSHKNRKQGSKSPLADSVQWGDCVCELYCHSPCSRVRRGYCDLAPLESIDAIQADRMTNRTSLSQRREDGFLVCHFECVGRWVSIVDQGQNHAVQVDEEAEQVEAKFDHGLLHV